MNELDHAIGWSPLPPASRRRVNWDELYAPLIGLFHAGAKPAHKAVEECTPQRLASLRTRAGQALSNMGPVFAAEAARLRRERYVILGSALAVSLILIILACLTSTKGYELIKSFLTAGGTGGLMAWGITTAFRRSDHEAQLKLFPAIFAAQFDLCADCDAYERVFEQFVRAIEALRGGQRDARR